MQIKCPKCHTVTAADGVTIDVVHFGCPSCRSLITFKNGTEGQVLKTFNAPTTDPILSVGQKGTFDGVEYTVTGVVVKQVQQYYYWREYILTAVANEQLYLSETDGHWILLRKVDDKYDVQGYPEAYDYDGMTLKLYDYDDPKTYTAEGFFDYDVSPKKQRMIEYINPPYIYSVEEIDKEFTVYFGEHISPAAIKKAFGIKSVPSRLGVGIVQPFGAKLQSMGIIFSTAAVLILVSHLIIYSGKEGKAVLRETLNFSDYNTKDFVSPPFTLEGGSAPLTIKLQSDVDNSWAAAQVALVNETTNSEEYAAKDIEYYHGYEGAENWSEGSRAESFNICGVGAGRYHLVITPQKPPEDLNNNTMHVSAEWDQPTAWNMILPITGMAIIFAITFFINANFNQRRWADSSYSPYNKDE